MLTLSEFLARKAYLIELFQKNMANSVCVEEKNPQNFESTDLRYWGDIYSLIEPVTLKFSISRPDTILPVILERNYEAVFFAMLGGESWNSWFQHELEFIACSLGRAAFLSKW